MKVLYNIYDSLISIMFWSSIRFGTIWRITNFCIFGAKNYIQFNTRRKVEWQVFVEVKTGLDVMIAEDSQVNNASIMLPKYNP